MINRPVARFLERRRLARFRTHQRAVFVTFADGKLFKSERLQREIAETCFFDEIHAFDGGTLGNEFYEKFAEHVKYPRGFGFWCWKPYVIKKVLQQLNDGDLLVYADSGCTVSQNAAMVLMSILSQALHQPPTIFAALNKESDHPIGDRTKADLLNEFGYVGNPEVLRSRQWEAGRLAMLKSPSIMALMSRWCDLAANLHLIDDSPSNLSEESRFLGHRHDQSILNLLLIGQHVQRGLENALYADRRRD